MMNFHGVEPMAPPRRKRSLSATRFDYQDEGYGGYSGAGSGYFPTQNRYNQRTNVSSDHLPALYNQIHNGPPGFGGGFRGARPSSLIIPPPPSGTATTPSASILLAASIQAPPTSPRFMNPYIQNKTPIRPHFDYLKYGQGMNVSYNPYQPGKIDPTLMARPAIDGYRSTSISPPVADAIARGRHGHPLYSSREQMDQIHQSNAGLILINDDDDYYDPGIIQNSFVHPNTVNRKIPPERPPPPKFSSVQRLHSVDNVSQPYDQWHEPNAGRRHLDRRSMSPTRNFAVPGAQQPQRAYQSHRATSPLPDISGSAAFYSPPSSPLSRSPSVTNYHQNRYPSSREPSRSPSPMRTFSPPPPPVTTTGTKSRFFENSINAAKSILTRRTNISPITSKNRSRSPMPEKHLSFLSVDSTLDQPRSSSSLLSVPDPSDFHHHDSKRMNDSGFGNQQGTEGEKQFSQAFTDHCDQYKSVTSKILKQKRNSSSVGNSNRYSGDFTDDNSSTNYEKFVDQEPPMESMNQYPQMTSFSSNNNSYMENNFDTVSQSSQQPPPPPPPLSPLDKKPNGLVPPESNGFKPSPNAGRASLDLGDHRTPLVQPTANKQEPQLCRRNSSSGSTAGNQRKASLPAEYIAAAAGISRKSPIRELPDDWSRENVANMAHEARLRKTNPPGRIRETVKTVGTWVGRQFVFLLIAALNIALAYMFYNLVVMLPKD